MRGQLNSIKLIKLRYVVCDIGRENIYCIQDEINSNSASLPKRLTFL